MASRRSRLDCRTSRPSPDAFATFWVLLAEPKLACPFRKSHGRDHAIGQKRLRRSSSAKFLCRRVEPSRVSPGILTLRIQRIKHIPQPGKRRTSCSKLERRVKPLTV